MSGWWSGVEQLNNRTASVYLRALLLTGARREELASLTWGNVDFQWRKLTIADKVEDTRTIPLTPYLAQLLATLPRKQDERGVLVPHVNGLSEGGLSDDDQLVYVNGVLKGKLLENERLAQLAARNRKE